MVLSVCQDVKLRFLLLIICKLKLAFKIFLYVFHIIIERFLSWNNQYKHLVVLLQAIIYFGYTQVVVNGSHFSKPLFSFFLSKSKVGFTSIKIYLVLEKRYSFEKIMKCQK